MEGPFPVRTSGSPRGTGAATFSFPTIRYLLLRFDLSGWTAADPETHRSCPPRTLSRPPVPEVDAAENALVVAVRCGRV
jgi:hypothetical protein